MRIIPFNIKYRPEIEAGEMKVVNGQGKAVTILKWDMQGNYPILGVVMTNHTNWDGDESWEEERPFAYSAEGHPTGYIPAHKGKLHLLINEADPSALDKELASMLDYARNHAKPEADVVSIFRDRIVECVRNEMANQT